MPAIRTVYAFVARTLQTSHLEEMESYDREKGGLKDYIRSVETQPITNREYISWGKPVSSIGLMPLLLENALATALLNYVMNLVKGAVEHLNPN